jgi:hypothetical protein
MDGRLRDAIPRPNISLPSVVRPSVGPKARVYGLIGAVFVAMSISFAGVLSGAGIFILAMLAGAYKTIIVSSFLLSFSISSLLLCYGWMTA